MTRALLEQPWAWLPYRPPEPYPQGPFKNLTIPQGVASYERRTMRRLTHLY